MSNTVDILDHIPHLEGEAHCLACKHQWEATAPIGAFWLECPECHTVRGCFRRHISVPEGMERFACGKCDVQIFFVMRKGIKCLGCATVHKWESIK